jgi:N-glycosylase/DNA lyase
MSSTANVSCEKSRSSRVADCTERAAIHRRVFAVRNYDLDSTLSCGQAFRWRFENGTWTGVIGARTVRLIASPNEIVAETPQHPDDWQWLNHYLQLHVDLEAVFASFPDDEPLRRAKTACAGLRLLVQDPWETLASFILSSTKQIVQIQQIVVLLCQRYGSPIRGLNGETIPSFPSPEALARCTEAQLRACKMGFRAPNLLATSRLIADGKIDLQNLKRLPIGEAREDLVQLPGVGRKIADCVLLYGMGFPTAFPVDVWILRALQKLYFKNRAVPQKRLFRFIESYFGPHAGYAQQYLFHYMRTQGKSASIKP